MGPPRPSRAIRRATVPSPLGPSISPYVSRFPFVRWMAYSRYQAALDMVVCPSPRRVLDFGCWDGAFLPTLLAHFPEVCGIDDDSCSLAETLKSHWTILTVARGHAPVTERHRLGVVKASGERLPFPDGSFDVVFSIDTLVHVAPESRHGVIEELSRVTSRDGQVIVVLPIETGRIGCLKLWLRRRSGKQIDVATLTFGDVHREIQRVEAVMDVPRRGHAPPGWLGKVLTAGVVLDCRPR